MTRHFLKQRVVVCAFALVKLNKVIDILGITAWNFIAVNIDFILHGHLIIQIQLLNTDKNLLDQRFVAQAARSNK